MIRSIEVGHIVLGTVREHIFGTVGSAVYRLTSLHLKNDE